MLPSNWNAKPLKDCATWYSGGTPSKANPNYWGGTIPWISAKSLTDFFIADSEEKVTEAGASNGTRIVPKDTILFLVRGMSLKSEFRIGITTRPVTFNQDLKALVAEDGVLPSFLAYAIKARTPEILELVGEAGHGTGVLPTDRIKSLEIPLPPMSEQRAVAHVLRSLDDKIQLNRQMNAKLEAIARLLFKSWFVDFDPVKAKAEGREASGMDAETAALFPGQFEESELGKIPEAWKVRSVAELAEYVNGRNFTKDATGRGRLVIRIRELKSGPNSSTVYNEVETASKHIANRDTILFAWSGSLDVYRWHLDEALINQHIFKVIPRSEYPKWFVYFCLDHVMPFFRQIAASKATTMGHIKRSHLEEAKVAVPKADFLRAADAIVRPLYEKIHANARESIALEKSRDGLLPKLMSGEIRLGEVKARVKEETAV